MSGYEAHSSPESEDPEILEGSEPSEDSVPDQPLGPDGMIKEETGVDQRAGQQSVSEDIFALASLAGEQSAGVKLSSAAAEVLKRWAVENQIAQQSSDLTPEQQAGIAVADAFGTIESSRSQDPEVQ